MDDPAQIANGILMFLVLVLSLSVHEFAHAAAAFRLGDDTASLQGRMTLNPLAHMDPVGTVLFPLLGILSAVPFLIGWAKPVPTNPLRLRWHMKGQALVAVAGPASNVVLALISLIGLFLYARILYPLVGRPILAIEGFLFYGVLINFLLAAFNMIPVPPLDGSWIVRWRLRGRWAELYEQYVMRYGFLVLIILFFSGALKFLLFPVMALTYLLLGLVS